MTKFANFFRERRKNFAFFPLTIDWRNLRGFLAIDWQISGFPPPHGLLTKFTLFFFMHPTGNFRYFPRKWLMNYVIFFSRERLINLIFSCDRLTNIAIFLPRSNDEIDWFWNEKNTGIPVYNQNSIIPDFKYMFLKRIFAVYTTLKCSMHFNFNPEASIWLMGSHDTNYKSVHLFWNVGLLRSSN